MLLNSHRGRSVRYGCSARYCTPSVDFGTVAVAPRFAPRFAAFAVEVAPRLAVAFVEVVPNLGVPRVRSILVLWAREHTRGKGVRVGSVTVAGVKAYPRVEYRTAGYDY